MPVISIIVPVYKVEQYLRRCVDSILNQTFRDFELILVDDGSPDNCPAICDEYAVKDCRIHVIHHPQNQGLAAARHHGVDQAKADWICFVDSDDLIHPQMLEHMYGITEETGVEIAACSAVEAENVPDDFWRDRADTVVYQTADEKGLLTIQNEWKYCYWVVWGKLIRKRIILKLPMTEGRIYEDNAIVFRWLHEAGTVAYTNSSYYFYQVNPTGITKSAFSLARLDNLWALQEQIVFYRKVGYTVLDKKMTARFLVDSVWNMDRCVNILNDQETANDIRRRMKANLRGMRLSSLPLTEYHRKCVWEKIYPCKAFLRRILRKSFRRFKSFVKSIICK